jgi:predicted transcriptional regulator
MTRQVTITLDDDVAARLEREALRAGRTADEIVNEAVRVRLPQVEERPARPFVVRARSMGVRPGVNFDCIGRLLDELDEEERSQRRDSDTQRSSSTSTC